MVVSDGDKKNLVGKPMSSSRDWRANGELSREKVAARFELSGDEAKL